MIKSKDALAVGDPVDVTIRGLGVTRNLPGVVVALSDDGRSARVQYAPEAALFAGLFVWVPRAPKGAST